MVISNEKTVGELAREVPASLRIFEKHGIDYCCGGNNPVETACRQRGITLKELAGEIEQASAGGPRIDDRDWETTRLAELIDYILAKHHDFLKSELPRIEELFAKVLRAHGEREPGLYRASDVYAGLKDELTTHMMKEEMILFPAIKQLESPASRPSRAAICGSIQHPIARMEHEHDNAGWALGELRRSTSDYALPQGACNTYRALFQALEELETDLHRHIHLENNILFPRAKQLEQVQAG